MSYFTKLLEDESLQELAYDEYRRKMDYRLIFSDLRFLSKANIPSRCLFRNRKKFNVFLFF
ncbi:MAG: hypothetical protein GDA46_05565 [Bdellovibrionales bacterium]|nr:hypothetical protein [Bdellovibrionales bacterium]